MGKRLHKKIMAVILTLALMAGFIPLQAYAGTAAWEEVGTSGFPFDTASSISITQYDGTPYIAYVGDSDFFNIVPIVKKYNGSAWVTLGREDFAASGSNCPSLFVDGGIPYIAYWDGDQSYGESGNDYKITVKRYDSGSNSWQAVGSPGFSNAGVDLISLYVRNGIPFVAYRNTDDHKITVKAYNSGIDSWVTLGNPSFSDGEIDSLSLAFKDDVTPCVAYHDATNHVVEVEMLDRDSNTWQFLGSTDFPASITCYVKLAFYAGIPYVLYNDDSQNSVLKAYDGSTWNDVGGTISDGGTSYNSLYIDDSTPYVAYQDAGNSFRATVKKYTGSSWQTVGGSAASTGLADYTSVCVIDGAPYLAYQSGLKLTVMKCGTSADSPDSWSDGENMSEPAHDSGTNTYTVTSPEELAWFANAINTGSIAPDSNATVSASGSIDLSAHEWVPIGNVNNPYAGAFDGGGCTITGLTINSVPNSVYDSGSPNYTGMFGSILDATIRGITLSGASIALSSGNNWDSVGALAGYAYGSPSITDCSATGSIALEYNGLFSGGLIGSGDGVTLKGCTSSVTVTSEFSNSGGLAGQIMDSGSISRSFATGDVTVPSDYSGNSSIQCGGLIGVCEGALEKSYATGNVSGPFTQGGGLVGSVIGGSTITNCYETGNVSGTNTIAVTLAGGLIGSMEIGGCSISRTYSAGTVGTASWSGGFIGYYGGAGNTLAGVYYNNANAYCYNNNPSALDGVAGKTQEDMQTSAFADTLNTGNAGVWSYDPAQNGGYPFLAPDAAAYTVGGTVTAGSGVSAPVSGITVTLYSSGTATGYSAATGTGGAYSVADVPPGTYTAVVAASSGDYAESSSAPFTVADGNVTGADITLLAEPVSSFTVSGTVAYSGLAMGGLTITLYDASDSPAGSAVTDGDGAYSIDNPVGAGSYRAVVSGLDGYYEETSSDITVASDGMASGVSFSLTKSAGAPDYFVTKDSGGNFLVNGAGSYATLASALSSGCSGVSGPTIYLGSLNGSLPVAETSSPTGNALVGATYKGNLVITENESGNSYGLTIPSSVSAAFDGLTVTDATTACTGVNVRFNIVYVNGGSLSLNASAISAQCINALGVALLLNGSLTMTDSTIAVTGTSATGIENGGSGPVVINDSTITNSSGTCINKYNTGTLTINGGETNIACTGYAYCIYDAGSGAIRLNGGQINSTNLYAIWNRSSAPITVDGASVSGKMYGIYNMGAGRLTLKSGTVATTGSYAVYNGGTADIEICGAAISTSGSGTMYGIYNYATGSVTMSSGSITCANSGSYGLYNSGMGAVNVTGGTITGTAFGICNNSGGAVAVSGGTVKSTAANGFAIYESGASSGTVTVSDSAVLSSVSASTVKLMKYSAADTASIDLFGVKIYGHNKTELTISGVPAEGVHTITPANYTASTLNASNTAADDAFAGWTGDPDRTALLTKVNGDAIVNLLNGNDGKEIYACVVLSASRLDTPAAAGGFADSDQTQGEISGAVGWSSPTGTAGITGYNIYWGSDAATKLAGHTDPVYTVSGVSTLAQAVPENTALPAGAAYFLIYSCNPSGDGPGCLAVAITDVYPVGPATYNVSGRVDAGSTDLTDTSGITVTLWSSGAATGYSAVTGAGGAYSIDDVPEGTYTAVIAALTDSYAGSSSAPFTVSGADVTAADITLLEPERENTAPDFLAGSGARLSVAVNSAAASINELLRVDDPDSGQTLTWTANAEPGHGILSVTGATASSGGSEITPGGTITYTPSAGFSGIDSFEIQVSDGTAAETITVTVYIGFWDSSAARGYDGGDGTEGSPYEIANAAQLAYLALEVNSGSSYENKYFTLTGDIDLSGHKWAPIGSYDSIPFKGVFDGAGHVVSNLTTGPESEIGDKGLFGALTGTVKNLGVENFTIYSNGPCSLGGIAAVLLNGKMLNCYAAGNIVSTDCYYAGGLAGANSAGYIYNCFSLVNIENTINTNDFGFIGGISGCDYGGVTINCYAAGELEGGSVDLVGALLGGGSGSVLTDCYWNSDAAQTVGGTTTSGAIGYVDGQVNSDATSMTAAEMKLAAFAAALSETAEARAADGFIPWKLIPGKNSGYPMPEGVGNGTEALTYTIAPIPDQTLSALTNGYSSGTQETKTITITRTGTGDLADLAVALSGGADSNFVLGSLGATTLDGTTTSTTFTVKAKDGLAAGSYTDTVTVSAANMTDATFTVRQAVDEALTYTIAAIGDQTMPAQTAGYAPGTQETRTITVTRTGTGDLDNLAAALSGGGNSSFDVTQPSAAALNSGTTSTTFTVKAKDGLAAGTYTETVTVSADNMTDVTFTVTQVINALPAPTVQSAVAGDAHVSITWSSVPEATGYNLYMSTASGSYGDALATADGSVYSYDATGLTNGTTYYFVVKAVNGGEESADSNEMSATPQVAAPGAPVLQSAAAGDGHVTITWSEVAGSTGYKIYASTTSGSYAEPVTTAGALEYSYDVTELTNGTTYYFAVKAVNPGGDSDYSNEISAMPQVTAPSAPTGLTATGGNAKVSLNWESTAGATAYKIYQATAPGAYGSALAAVDGSVHSYEAAGLTNGATYYFVVKAANAGGDSPGSAEVSAVPVTVPRAPTNVSAAAGDGQAAVTFAAPADNGGSPVTGYVVTSNPGNVTAAGTGTAITVTGLTNGTAYTFTVKAVNAAGSGQDSTASNAVTPYRPSGGNTGENKTPTEPTRPSESGADIIINGKAETAATTTTTRVEDKTVTTIKIDGEKIEERLQAEGNNVVVTIPVKNDADVVVGQLNGQTVKNMENREAVLEIKTGNVTYTLPAAQINIDSVSSQMGKQVELKDIAVNVIISVPSQEIAEIVQDTANRNNYQVVVKPVEFEITCTSGDKTVEVSRFNGYVERMVAIPDGVDPGKITTGIVLNPDGTFSHVPTTITVIDGKYYAKINSLTNSAYSVIYHPMEFKDVANHWAEASINDMGSRLVISGSGEGMYEPDRDITRAEFASIVVRALGLMRPGTGKDAFGDVAEDSLYYDAVSIAYENGIISGYGNGKFGPMDKITREQAMTIIAGAMKITGLGVELADSEVSRILSGFADANSAAAYAKTGIAACVNAGVISGRPEAGLAPKDNITRAEVAFIVRSLLQKSGLI